MRIDLIKLTRSERDSLVQAGLRESIHGVLFDKMVALGSASEVRYLLGLAQRLGFLPLPDHAEIDKKCDALLRTLRRLVDSLDARP
jgi:four helix bundle protein